MQTNEWLPWLVPLLPLLGFFANAFLGGRLKRSVVGGVATAVVAGAFLVSLALFAQVAGAPEHRVASRSFEWMVLPSGVGGGGFDLRFGLVLDPLSSLMLLIITGIGALIHLYSIGYMSHEQAYSRYFAYLNLFVFFMLLLVMASNLVVMFIGWEGVGLASYLLIGFWSERASATAAARKAFVVNRIGDAALLVALFLVHRYFGTFEFFGENGLLTANGLEGAARQGLVAGSLVANAVPLLLFAGATGKSAQLPLFVWLPDAMEGPTPVSALIHAATMVTAGVYLLARCHALFALSPVTMSIVAVIGLATAFVAATVGLVQNDIKRVLAYSTVSQLGFMFLACGVGAYGAAMFHVTTHAFFKALLFLGAGSVIHAMGGEQDMRKMGDLARRIPTTFRTMLVGTLAIAGIPPLAGFWSKDEILASAFGRNPVLFGIGLATACITAIYMFRMLGLTFFGKSRMDSHTEEHVHESPAVMTVPLIVLAGFSLVVGFLNAPAIGIHAFSHWLGESVGPEPSLPQGGMALGLLALSALVAAGASAFGWARFRELPAREPSGPLHGFLSSAWGIESAYGTILVQPGIAMARFLARVLDRIALDGVVRGAAGLVTAVGSGAARLQNGFVRSYAVTALLGAVALAIVLAVGMSSGGH
ncbi:MAG: NADH-quinone oxidoreductase subunit L [Armatimonadota bacterium]